MSLFEQSVGAWVKLEATTSVEILAYAGYDFVVIDLEHTMLSPETVRGMIAVARATGMQPLVRVDDHSPSAIQRILDAGAAGILVPHVDTVEQARALAAAFRFPPRGLRGAGSTGPAGRWGQSPRSEYLRSGDEVLFIPQLESRAAVESASEIGAVDGVDAIFFGAADLALDVGSRDDAEELVDAARSAAAAAGLRCGSATPGPAGALRAFGAGDAFVVCGNDASLLAAAAIEARAAAAPPRSSFPLSSPSTEPGVQQ